MYKEFLTTWININEQWTWYNWN